MTAYSVRLRTAFTLVELLVVIAIIGMLMALLIPAVNAARESARANTCRNNMRNLATAIILYEGKNNRYPALFGNRYTRPNGSYTERPLIYAISPELGQANLFKRYGVNWSDGALDKVPDTHLDILVCPSDAQDPSQNPSPISFVFNAGKVNSAGVAEPISSTTKKAHGVFFPVGAMSSSDVFNNDGLGTTLMLSENLDAGNWNVWYTAGTPPVPPKGQEVEFVWWDIANGSSPNEQWPKHSINALPSAPFQIATDYNFARPSSNHGNGVNVAFCDSSVRFIEQSIDYLVYIQLMTTNSLQSVFASDPSVSLNFQLQENQY
jgi:prepilin-type N-terminal cleavage/methylation domain-containing protein/prepilin-type processing-associated H-X9-DG protein